ncbi:hypothetical protein MHYP_G00173140 [Metynnis hypsauchen]
MAHWLKGVEFWSPTGHTLGSPGLMVDEPSLIVRLNLAIVDVLWLRARSHFKNGGAEGGERAARRLRGTDGPFQTPRGGKRRGFFHEVRFHLTQLQI